MKKQSKIENYIQIIVWVGMIFFITSQMAKYTIEGEFKIAAYVLLAIISIYVILGPIWKEKSNLKNIQKAGMEGEQRVQNELKLLNEDKYKVINSIYLRGTNLTQEFDSIVISDKGIFNIECKNFSGDISITRDGIWNRKKRNGSQDILQNPTPQVLRHRSVLESIVGNVNIIDVIVISNEMVNIDGSENSSVPVVKYDRLLDFIDDYNGESKYNINDIYNQIAPKINGHSSINDYSKKPFYRNIEIIVRVVMFIVLFSAFNYKSGVAKDIPVIGDIINGNPISLKLSEVKELNVETKALDGQVTVKVNKCIKKRSKITISGEVINKADNQVSMYCKEFYLGDKDEKSYKLDFFKNKKFNKEIPSGAKDDFNIVFEDIDTNKEPFELRGKLFIMGREYSKMDKKFLLKLDVN